MAQVSVEFLILFVMLIMWCVIASGIVISQVMILARENKLDAFAITLAVSALICAIYMAFNYS
jgi:hypothetical protein